MSLIKPNKFNSPKLEDEDKKQAKEKKSVMKEAENELSVRVERIGDSSLAKMGEKK